MLLLYQQNLQQIEVAVVNGGGSAGNTAKFDSRARVNLKNERAIINFMMSIVTAETLDE